MEISGVSLGTTSALQDAAGPMVLPSARSLGSLFSPCHPLGAEPFLASTLQAALGQL